MMKKRCSLTVIFLPDCPQSGPERCLLIVPVYNDALDELAASLQYRCEIRLCSRKEDCTTAISTAAIRAPNSLKFHTDINPDKKAMFYHLPHKVGLKIRSRQNVQVIASSVSQPHPARDLQPRLTGVSASFVSPHGVSLS
jgi:hypothetical protein